MCQDILGLFMGLLTFLKQGENTKMIIQNTKIQILIFNPEGKWINQIRRSVTSFTRLSAEWKLNYCTGDLVMKVSL